MIRVLVVDDHPVLRAGLEAVLRAEPGFRCVGAAGDGEEMWCLLARTQPDVVVLDLRLGDEDGVALCRAIRAGEEPPAVLLYTADVTDDLRVMARAAGAADAVEKVRPVDELFDAIRLAGRPPDALSSPAAA
jgi:DNA-binding NarL/FixJ family response regulator